MQPNGWSLWQHAAGWLKCPLMSHPPHLRLSSAGCDSWAVPVQRPGAGLWRRSPCGHPAGADECHHDVSRPRILSRGVLLLNPSRDSPVNATYQPEVPSTDGSRVMATEAAARWLMYVSWGPAAHALERRPSKVYTSRFHWRFFLFSTHRQGRATLWLISRQVGPSVSSLTRRLLCRWHWIYFALLAVPAAGFSRWVQRAAGPKRRTFGVHVLFFERRSAGFTLPPAAANLCVYLFPKQQRLPRPNGRVHQRMHHFGSSGRYIVCRRDPLDLFDIFIMYIYIYILVVVNGWTLSIVVKWSDHWG